MGSQIMELKVVARFIVDMVKPENMNVIADTRADVDLKPHSLARR